MGCRWYLSMGWALDHGFIIGAVPCYLVLEEVGGDRMLRIDFMIENTMKFACAHGGLCMYTIFE